MTAATLLVMMGITALAIDLGYLLNGKAELQNALDSAALAAVSQTHVVIPDQRQNYTNEQISLIYKYAKKYASQNEVRQHSDGGNAITLDERNSEIDVSRMNDNSPRITINKQILLPTFFAGILGFNGVNVSARAQAQLVPVNGGTGLISGGKVIVGNDGSYGAVVSGGWRPLIIPDTYFAPDLSDSNCPCGTDCAVILRQLSYNSLTNDLTRPSDRAFYRSRFASMTSSYPYVDLWQDSIPQSPGNNCNPNPTSLRDTFALVTSTTLNNIMGAPFRLEGNPAVAPTISDYRIVDFAASYGLSNVGTIADHAYFGFNGRVKVGDVVTVLPVGSDAGAYDKLKQLRNDAFNYATNVRPDTSDTGKLAKYGYVTTCSGCPFEAPNTHPLIVPVLLCNPFEYYRKIKGIIPDDGKLTVTNIGALFIDTAGGGVITGRFVREIFVGGTQVAPNSVAYPWMLPASTKLVR